MDALRLPVFHMSTSIPEALAAMREAGRSGVVAEDDKQNYWLLKAAAMIVARNREVPILGKVRPRHPIRPLTFDQVKTYGVDLVLLRQSEKAYEDLLDAEGVDYLCLAVVDESVPRGPGRELGYGTFATIVTRHEGLTEELSEPGDCYCTGPRQHSFPPPPAAEGDSCPAGDGATIVCE